MGILWAHKIYSLSPITSHLLSWGLPVVRLIESHLPQSSQGVCQRGAEQEGLPLARKSIKDDLQIRFKAGFQ